PARVEQIADDLDGQAALTAATRRREDDLGRLYRADGPQRQQLRIARSHADAHQPGSRRQAGPVIHADCVSHCHTVTVTTKTGFCASRRVIPRMSAPRAMLTWTSSTSCPCARTQASSVGTCSNVTRFATIRPPGAITSAQTV